MQKNTIKKAGAIIINRELKAIALVWRPREKDWTFPKGHIEEGENETEVMTREVLEETGMLVEIKDVLPSMEYLDSNGQRISLKMFLTIFVQNKTEDKTGDEKVEWISFDEVAQKLSYQNLKEYFLSIQAVLEECCDEACSFCAEDIKLSQEIIRSKNIRIIYPRRPIIEANVMLLPVRHVKDVDELTDDEILELLSLVRRINRVFASLYETTGYNLFVNNGEVAGQHIPHVHFHFYGRNKNEAISPFAVLNNPEASAKIARLSPAEIKRRIDVIKDEFNRMTKRE